MPDVPHHPEAILADAVRRAQAMRLRVGGLGENLAEHRKTDSQGVERCAAVAGALETLAQLMQQSLDQPFISPTTTDRKNGHD